jgi:hypothetical protein
MKRIERTYQVQVVNLPDHLVPHEGSWTACGEPTKNRKQALELVGRALISYTHARLLTKEIYVRG